MFPTSETQDLQVTLHHAVYPGVDLNHHFKTHSYKNKVVLISGAAGRLGRTTALFYARCGASLSLLSNSIQQLSGLKSIILEVVPGANVATFKTDVRVVRQVQAAIEGTAALFGRLDMCLALSSLEPLANLQSPIAEPDPYAWWDVLETNVRGVYNVAHFSMPYLEQNQGYFLMMSSPFAAQLFPAACPFSVSRDALSRMNEYIAQNHPKIKSFTVSPGFLPEDNMEYSVQTGSRDSIDEAELSAATIIRLTSGKDDWLTGRFVSSNWDLDELELAWKDLVLKQDALVHRLLLPVRPPIGSKK
ncbi:NAD(P)-binding protein [Sistotremastrum suecicum HHB10207 ss-3]|uniref:NAD(P)-binding protein n=1 Tax=Sistotremastrum suecicum HHB10207 ss-3 TaxID=1314776 RepID=A0A165Z580_9AGAM|nr:NAD(P)-binding protein [Sistotremastrum suecicum HHB10207 ss-3]